jgi:membrane protease YdiL (CAAX protease family)
VTAPSSDRQAASLRGFGLVGIIAGLFILAGNALFVPGSAVLALAWTWWSRTPWREIGYTRPKNWTTAIVAGIAGGAALKVVMKALVMPLLGAPPINEYYHFLAHNPAAVPSMLYLIITGAGFGEETTFRGYLFERFGKLFGHSAAAKATTVVITALWFGFSHYATQGVPGTEQAIVTGLIFGGCFAVTGCIWPLMIAHAAFDLTAYAMIYWDYETTVAHLIFR